MSTKQLTNNKMTHSNHTYNRFKLEGKTVSHAVMPNDILKSKPNTYKLFIYKGVKYAHNIHNDFIYELINQ